MQILMWIFAGFAVISAIDLIFGNKFGLGTEFRVGIMSSGTLMLSMGGMIVLAPLLGELLSPWLEACGELWIDPSVIPSCLIANDMGGAPLADALAQNGQVGKFNGLVIASMMGATMSFTLPFALNTVDKQRHGDLTVGLLCGIATVPVGAFVGGLIMGIGIVDLLLDLLPLILFAGIIAFGLLKFPRQSVKIFKVFGIIVNGIIIAGLALAIVRYLTDIEFLESAGSLGDAMSTVLGITAVLCGVFPMIYVLSKLLRVPLERFGKLLGINADSALGLLSSLANNVTTFGNSSKMDSKGLIINSAFAVSASFTLADHLAFTSAYMREALPAVITAKLTAGICAVVLALLLYRRREKTGKN